MMIEEFLINTTWFVYLALSLISLAVGSLLNVVIYRLPIMLITEWKEQCNEFFSIPNKYTDKSINLFLPRSFCPNCKSLVKAWHNIPLISYVMLKGHCGTCKAPISIRYPLIEILTLILSLLSFSHFGLTLQFVFVLVGIWLLIPLIFIDLEHQLLPDSLTLSFLWLGLIANTQNLFVNLPNAVLSCAGAYLGLWLFIKIFYLITGKIGMGHGDFKLFAAFGAWLGWMYLPLILLLSSFSGAFIGVIYLYLSNKPKDSSIPFGPFLCCSGIICLFWGQLIVQTYLKWLGFII